MKKENEHPINKIVDSIKDNGWNYKIEFGKSRSKYYEEAVNIAENLPNYKFENNLHILEYKIEKINKNFIDELIELVNYIHNWKGSHFYINDIEVNHPIAAFNCYKGFLTEGITYCFDSNGALANVIGCKWSGVFGGVFPKYIQWEKFGEINNETCHLDKYKIKNITYENIGPYISCPHLGKLKFIEEINNLPAQVNTTNPENDVDNFPEGPDFSQNEFKSDENDYMKNKVNNKPSGCGCLGSSTLMLSIFIIILFML